MKFMMKRLGKSNIQTENEVENGKIMNENIVDNQSEGSLDENKMLSHLESYYNTNNINDRTESMYTEINIIKKYKENDNEIDNDNDNKRESIISNKTNKSNNTNNTMNTINTINIEERIRKFDGSTTLNRNRFGITKFHERECNNVVSNGIDDNKICCKICNNKHKDTYIILECNHTFHVNCLVENHLADIYNYDDKYISEQYIDGVKCDVCEKIVGSQELMYLHSKFLSNTRERMITQDDKINILEEKLRQIKDELRLNYEYKNRLEKEREVSKKVVNIAINMI